MNPFSKFKLTGNPKVSSPPPQSGCADAGSGTVPGTASSKSQPAQETGYSSRPASFGRTLWAMHPNRTTRKLRKLLVSWENLGHHLSFSGSPSELSQAREHSFLRTKVTVAKSVGFLKSIQGVGDIRREAGLRERDFIEILERYPSLHAVMIVDEEEKTQLFRAWHSLYLFLHRVLGADPYEVGEESAFFPVESRRELQTGRNVKPFRAGKTS